MHRWAMGAMALAACSYIGVTPPRSTPHEEPVECTTSRALPIIDTIVGGLFTVLTVANFVSFATCDEPDLTPGSIYGCDLFVAGGAIFAVPAILYGFSAGYGYSYTARCRQSVR